MSSPMLKSIAVTQLWGVLVLPKLQVNSQKLGVQALQNLEFE